MTQTILMVKGKSVLKDNDQIVYYERQRVAENEVDRISGGQKG